MKQQEANIAAGYAVTYVLGYILTLLYVPFVAPKLMGIDLKEEAAKLEAELVRRQPATDRKSALSQVPGARLSGLDRRGPHGRGYRRGDRQPHCRRANRAPGSRRRAAICDTILEAGDDIVIAGRTAAIVAAKPVIGQEIDADEILKAIPGNVIEVLVDSRNLHGRSIREIAERVGNDARGVFLRTLTRMGREVPLGPDTRVYVGDVMTLVGSTRNIERAATKVGQILRSGDRTDIAFLAAGIAVGLLAGLPASRSAAFALTLGGGGGALIAGLVCGWLRVAPADHRARCRPPHSRR